ncbi:MAG: hypothetical protein OXI55_16395 [Gammaproteobacteria bacterium]|nr:hypothetical protein [Gammaproteobacteria bacterium]
MKTILAALATLALAAAADDEKTAPTPEAVQSVASCYSTCYAQTIEHHRGVHLNLTRIASKNKGQCLAVRNVLHVMELCGVACNEIWAVHGKPDSKIRDLYRADVAAQVARYEVSNCETDAPYDSADLVLAIPGT